MKIGDSVVIKPDLKSSMKEDIVPEMVEYAGMTAAVIEVFDIEDGEIEFYIDIDDVFWTWTKNMIQEDPIEETN